MDHAPTTLIGDALNRVDGPAKVTGTAMYAGDFKIEGGISEGYIVEAPAGPGRITKLDVSAAENADGEWIVDLAATEQKRQALKQARLDESVDVRDWWINERKTIEQVDFAPEVREMYAQSLSFDKFHNEFVSFWQLGDDFAIAEE